MPVSEQQLAANRANAQKSHGPTSIAGKKRSSQNARRHGVTAQTTVMTDEDRLHHDAFCTKMMVDLEPIGSIETFLASSIAEEAWRLNHARAQCNNIIAIGHFDGTGDAYSAEHPEIETAITTAQTTRNNAKTLELLSLYAQRIHRAYEKYNNQLAAVQAERKAEQARQFEDARHLSQVAKLQKLAYYPVADGFVFSNREIDHYTDRFHRLELGKSNPVTYKRHANLLQIPELPNVPKAA